MAFPIFEIPPCSSLCSVANFETVSFTFLDDWFRRCNCKGDTSSSLLTVKTHDTFVRFRIIWSWHFISCLHYLFYKYTHTHLPNNSHQAHEDSWDRLHVYCLHIYKKNQVIIHYLLYPPNRDIVHTCLLLMSLIIKSLEFIQSLHFHSNSFLVELQSGPIKPFSGATFFSKGTNKTESYILRNKMHQGTN